MESTQAMALRSLLEGQQVAALATLHKGQPAQSMVPYALRPGGEGFIIHVSRLATHTADMHASPAVSLLVVAPPGAAATAQELQRASIQGRARMCPAGSPEHAVSKVLYLARFPHGEQMFAFSDFSLFVVEPLHVRFVGGFAQAATVGAEAFASIMRGGS
jgi:putative heme iron utilization protein